MCYGYKRTSEKHEWDNIKWGGSSVGRARKKFNLIRLITAIQLKPFKLVVAGSNPAHPTRSETL